MPPVKRIKPGAWAVRDADEATISSELIDVVTGETLVASRYNVPSTVLRRLASVHNGLLGVTDPVIGWPTKDWYAALPQFLTAYADLGRFTSPPNFVFVTLARDGGGLAGPSRHLLDAYVTPEFGLTIHLCGHAPEASVLLYEVRAGSWFKVCP